MERHLFYASYEQLRGTSVCLFLIDSGGPCGQKRYEHHLPVSTDLDPVARVKHEKERHNSLYYIFFKQSSLQDTGQ